MTEEPKNLHINHQHFSN